MRDLMPSGSILLVIHIHGGSSGQPSLCAAYDCHHHLEYRVTVRRRSRPELLLRLSLGSEKRLGIIQDTLADRRRAFAAGGIQLAGFARITVMLGEDRRHPLAILQALACHWHQKLQGPSAPKPCPRAPALGSPPAEPPPVPAAAIPNSYCDQTGAPTARSRGVGPTPANSQATSSEVSCSVRRIERSSSTAAASFIGHATASTVSRPNCYSAAIRL
jgi:hypothetical protein